MPIVDELLQEFDQEMHVTRRVLERVPDDRPDWRPHPKSFPVAHLAQLVATMPGWITRTLREPAINLMEVPGYNDQSTRSLVEQFDGHVAEARAQIEAQGDADWTTGWSLKRGDTVLLALPRGVAVRQHLNHLVHHRAQLGVYLRLLDVPVPSMYGPTADERSF